jgi:HK97 family phage prohead protease
LWPGLRERFEPGAFAAQVKDPGRVKIAYRHGEIIGRAIDLDDRADGLWVRGRIFASDDRPVARQALADLRDGLIDELSVGFQQVKNGTEFRETDKGTLVVHQRAALREISTVPWGAYSRKATVTKVREQGTGPDLDPAAELLAQLEHVTRQIGVVLATTR